MSIEKDLEYYIGRKPTSDEVAEAEEWAEFHPGVNLSEWVDAMIEEGQLS